jgi:alpha-beta hydrolase superfamily lysophospholipase
MSGMIDYKTTQLNCADDYTGKVIATLVAHPNAQSHATAVLYVHGFSDYFFHDELAQFFDDQNIGFYALDLRKYGRSLLAHQRANFCKDVREYYEEIDLSLDMIQQNHRDFMLCGHSTGGLILSLYAANNPNGQKAKALILNSPFFEFNFPEVMRKTLLPVLMQLGKTSPYANVLVRLSKLYALSLHKNYFGEWEYDLKLKPFKGFPIYAGWVRAIGGAQKRVRARLNLTIPILLLHSDKSIRKQRGFSDNLQEADIVLNVDDMRSTAPLLGSNLTHIELKNAMHDVFLSKKEVRQQAYLHLASWLKTI